MDFCLSKQTNAYLVYFQEALTSRAVKQFVFKRLRDVPDKSRFVKQHVFNCLGDLSEGHIWLFKAERAIFEVEGS